MEHAPDVPILTAATDGGAANLTNSRKLSELILVVGALILLVWDPTSSAAAASAVPNLGCNPTPKPFQPTNDDLYNPLFFNLFFI